MRPTRSRWWTALLPRGLAGPLLASLVGVVIWGTAATAAEEKSLVTIDDLYRFDSPTGMVISPDGTQGIYSRKWSDRASRTVRYSLWKVDENGKRRQPMEESEPDARNPILSPDGKWIAFQSTRSFPDGTAAFSPVPPYTDPATDLWLIRTSGGKAIPLAGPGKPYGRVFTDPFYGRVAFSPDGKRLAFVADDGKDPRTPEEMANNVRIVREDQGEGYEGYRTSQVWIADLAAEPSDVAAARVVRVTQDDTWYGDPQWHPDGRSLFVHANRTSERESVRYSINKNYDIWRIDLSSGVLEAITNGPGPEVCPRLSPDGRKLLCLSIPRRGSHFDVFNLLVVDLESSSHASHVIWDHHERQGEAPPHLPPLFPLGTECWLTDSRIQYQAASGVRNTTQVVEVVGSPKALADTSPEAHGETYARLVAEKKSLSVPGDEFLQQRKLAEGQVVEWTSFDERKIEGIFTPPTTPQAVKPYKLVLYPHGGPHSRSSLGFDFTVQVLAANGYAVFQPNFRGSAGYGQRFIDADRKDLGGGDMRDILTGIEYLVSEGLVDPKRQFVYGISYGGYMTSWLVGHTRQFRAAVPQNAVTDLNAMWGLSDIQSWTEWEFGGRPWEVPDAMRNHSPLTFASNVKTPTLILHSANDRRCPLPMGIMFYRALKSSGVETAMVIYPDEGHPIKQLPHQEDVLRRVLEWFQKHDQ